jgi:hypothetical protein
MHNKLTPRIGLTLVAAWMAGGALAAAHNDAEFAEAVAAYKAGNKIIAVSAFRDLAADGNPEAQHNLAILLVKGEGVPRNDREALYWAWRARLSGVKQSVGLVQLLELETAEDTMELVATKLEKDLMLRIKGGDAASMLALGRVKNEVRPEPDQIGALAWMTVAAAVNVEHAGLLRDALTLEMGVEDRQEAQDMAVKLFDNWCARDGQDEGVSCATRASR